MRFLVLAMCLFLLSGCTDNASGPEDDDNPGGDPRDGPADGSDSPPEEAGAPIEPVVDANGTITQIPWELHGCSFYYAMTQADADKVREHLPEGFTIGQGQVQVAYEFNSCNNGTGLHRFVEDMQYASVWVGVTPPDGGTSGVFSVVAFDVLIPDDDRREWLQDNGVQAHDGGLTAYTASGVNGVDRVSFTYNMDDVGEFTIDYAAPQSTPNAGGTFDQWTGDQLVYWKTDWQTSEQYTASATVTIPSGSIYADWYAAPTVPATLTLGTWDYTDGFIRLP